MTILSRINVISVCLLWCASVVILSDVTFLALVPKREF